MRENVLIILFGCALTQSKQNNLMNKLEKKKREAVRLSLLSDKKRRAKALLKNVILNQLMISLSNLGIE